MTYEPLGFYVDCDSAECADCHDPESWEGFESWTEPLAIFEDSESDGPTHCQVCESLIPHALTREGYEYVSEAISRAVEGDGRLCIVRQWAEEYGSPEDCETVSDWPLSDEWSPGGSRDRRAS